MEAFHIRGRNYPFLYSNGHQGQNSEVQLWGAALQALKRWNLDEN